MDGGTTGVPVAAFACSLGHAVFPVAIAIAGIAASASMRPRMMHACPATRSSCPTRAHHQPTEMISTTTPYEGELEFERDADLSIDRSLLHSL
jgi:hypothetical protein